MQTPDWVKTSIFYHIYPLGLLGASKNNSGDLSQDHRLLNLIPWLDHMLALGANALYLGPIFESSSHGYDTSDYFQIDRRLGTNSDMKEFSHEAHKRGIKIILDGVFNHSGRSFWAFLDIQKNGPSSPFVDWYMGMSFSGRNRTGDPFTYQNWNGHDSLVKFNLSNSAVRDYLFQAIQYWVSDWGIDGLRIDAADCISLDFLKDMRTLANSINTDFWLLGEIVHGDYREWVHNDLLHSVTNYECYKGLYSSINDENLFEIAFSLNRQFGKEGIYRDFILYNFVDNHDVNRIATQLNQKINLDLLYALLFTIPGIPSIYYGSEWGIEGMKTNYSDRNLRPAIALNSIQNQPPLPDVFHTIQKLTNLNRMIPALSHGQYEQAFVNSKQFGFWRCTSQQKVLVLINIDQQPYYIQSLPIRQSSRWYDPIANEDQTKIVNQQISLTIPPHAYRIIVFE
jgi:cyclomaltodextrinase